jgi:hypothetical protein
MVRGSFLSQIFSAIKSEGAVVAFCGWVLPAPGNPAQPRSAALIELLESERRLH